MPYPATLAEKADLAAFVERTNRARAESRRLGTIVLTEPEAASIRRALDGYEAAVEHQTDTRTRAAVSGAVRSALGAPAATNHEVEAAEERVRDAAAELQRALSSVDLWVSVRMTGRAPDEWLGDGLAFTRGGGARDVLGQVREAQISAATKAAEDHDRQRDKLDRDNPAERDDHGFHLEVAQHIRESQGDPEMLKAKSRDILRNLQDRRPNDDGLVLLGLGVDQATALARQRQQERDEAITRRVAAELETLADQIERDAHHDGTRQQIRSVTKMLTRAGAIARVEQEV